MVNNSTATTAPDSRCSRCGTPFHCGVKDPGGCWCAKMPALPLGALEAGRGCLCTDCLKVATSTPPVGPA